MQLDRGGRRVRHKLSVNLVNEGECNAIGCKFQQTKGLRPNSMLLLTNAGANRNPERVAWCSAVCNSLSNFLRFVTQSWTSVIAMQKTNKQLLRNLAQTKMEFEIHTLGWTWLRRHQMHAGEATKPYSFVGESFLDRRESSTVVPR